MKLRFFLLIFFSFLLFQAQSQAQQLSPQAVVSILTCNPGEDVYSIYGHTAIRINDPEQNLDAVFNYGVFSFDTPDFIYRFAKGQTDYLVIGQKFSSFMPEYVTDKRSVYEQVLNLTPEGKTQIFQALLENVKPENRMYRYNFFIDNCATRVRDMIEKNAGGKITFSDQQSNASYRDLIRHFHQSIRWTDLGIDLMIGKKADEPVSAYGKMFLPEYLENEFATAQIELNGKSQPLVLETRTLLEYPNAKLNSEWPWPTIAFGLLFVLIGYFSVRAFRLKRAMDWLDYSLFALTGIAGFMIGWFVLYSEHPAMSPNFNLLWLFPPNLFFAFFWKIKRWRKFTRFYLYLVAALLVIAPFAGQTFNPAVYFLILILLVRVIAMHFTEKQTFQLDLSH